MTVLFLSAAMSVVADQELIASPPVAAQDSVAPVFPPSDLYSDEPPWETGASKG